MPAWWSGSVAALLASEPAVIVGTLARHLVGAHARNHPQQLRAWHRDIILLADALRSAPPDWHLLLEYPIVRLGQRIDAVLLTDRAILVLEFKGADISTSAGRQVEDYALDLFEFHAACRAHPVVPILVADLAVPPVASWPLLWHGVMTPPLQCGPGQLAAMIGDVQARIPLPAVPLGTVAWADAPYRPVPSIIDAACMLYARSDVADIRAARADATNLTLTTDAILRAIADARAAGRRIIQFVTGIPGAGKTLCGLNVVFGAERDAAATFLTGNPTLVHVLRGALARHAAGDDRRALGPARRRMRALIQELPKFRDHYVGRDAEVPAEQVVVIDEAQRAWSAHHAIRKSRDRPVALLDSEPAIILDVMERIPDWSVIVCLVGTGQEIHDGEGGLAQWSDALAARPGWHIRAAPDAVAVAPSRQALRASPRIARAPELHLRVPVRHIRGASASGWVEAVMRGDASAASAIADTSPVPFRLTRSLDHMRAALRTMSRGLRRCGLLASSGAVVRLRADGVGVEVPHMDASAVEHWFLDRWPCDVRASDALEQVATEFSCQGLELDFVGLCWGADLVRVPARAAWGARAFSGTKWQRVRDDTERHDNRINTYRVLLTRARYETVIWVPRGDAEDTTRDPAVLDAIAGFLMACGMRELEGDDRARSPERREETLL